MRFLMSFEYSAGDEVAVAYFASVRLLAGMTTNVLLQVTAFLEGGYAVVATERTVVHHRVAQVTQSRVGRNHTCCW